MKRPDRQEIESKSANTTVANIRWGHAIQEYADHIEKQNKAMYEALTELEDTSHAVINGRDTATNLSKYLIAQKKTIALIKSVKANG